MTAVLAVAVLAIGIVAAYRQDAVQPDRRHRLVGWGSDATLEMRDAGDGGVLLAPGIRIIEPAAGAARVSAYRLDLQSLDVQPVAHAVWMSASGAIVECDRAGLAPASRFDVTDGRLQISRRPVSTHGTVRHGRLSPDGRHVAVTSASGASMPRLSPIPTLGGGSVVGWRFHQFVRVPTGDLHGPLVALGFGAADPFPCWTPNGEAVVYADAGFTDIALVLVPR